MLKFIRKIKRQRLLNKQKLFIDQNDWGMLSKFLPLDDEAEIYLVKSKWIEGIGTYQRFYSFHTPARALLVEENMGYASDDVINSGLSLNEEQLLATKGDCKNIKLFIDRGYPFSEENEFLFVKRALEDKRIENLVIYYSEKLKFLHSQKAERI